MLLRQILTIVILLTPFYLWAAKNSVKNMLDIDKICRKSPTDCLFEVNQKLQQTPVQSRVWYDLMQYKFENLFVLQKINILNQITKPLIKNKKLPIPFQVSLFIYYAKSLNEDKTLNKEEIKQEQKIFIDKAQNLLGLMNNIYPNPNLLIQLANLQMYVGDYKKAYQLLQSLIVKYNQYPDLAFNLDLYGNLGHLADRLNYKNQAIKYWSTSLYWAKQLDNNQQTATVYFNLANSQTIVNDFNKAKSSVINAIKYATLAHDDVKCSQAQLLYVQILLDLKQKVEARKILDSVQINTLSEASLTKFMQLKTKI